MTNEVLQALQTRSSIRSYTDEALTPDEIQFLKEAALAAPTARNLQNQRFYFITDKNLLEEINKEIALSTNNGVLPENYRKATYDAPLTVVIACTKGSRYGLIDSGISVQSIAIAAKSIGLDTVILGMVEYAFQYGLSKHPEKFRKAVGMGDELEFAIAISVGHKAADKIPHTVNFDHIKEI